jgi:uncharacterized protein (UPF0333 family)
MRGQVAFELLFLVLIVLTAAIAVASMYLQSHEDTLAISAARTELLNQIGTKNENIVIDYVKIEKTSATELHIKTTPTTTINTNEIKQRVASVSGYKNITIIFD